MEATLYSFEMGDTILFAQSEALKSVTAQFSRGLFLECILPDKNSRTAWPLSCVVLHSQEHPAPAWQFSAGVMGQQKG